MSNEVFNYLQEAESEKLQLIREFNNPLYEKISRIEKYLNAKKNAKVILWKSNSPLKTGENVKNLLLNMLEHHTEKTVVEMSIGHYKDINTEIDDDSIVVINDPEKVSNIYPFHEKLMANNHSLFLNVSGDETAKRLNDELSSLDEVSENFVYIPLNTGNAVVSEEDIKPYFFKALSLKGYDLVIPENDAELMDYFNKNIDLLKTAESLSNTIERTIKILEEQEETLEFTDDGKIIFRSDMLKKSAKEVMREVREELDELVGMANVKEQFEKMFSYLKFNELMAKRTGEPFKPNLHTGFLGNPGTGKTTVAKIYAKALCGLGYVSTDKLTITTEKDLVAGYVGQTSIKTEEKIQEAMGGVLFIDEAYSMNNDPMYAPQAIATMLKHMEDPEEDIVFIFAGYSGPMKKFFGSNPGLSSRVNLKLNFNDFSNNELVEILERKAEEKSVNITNIKDKLVDIFKTQKTKTGERNFGNGRFVMNLFQDMLFQQAYNQRDNLMEIDVSQEPEMFDEIFELNESSIPSKYFEDGFFNRNTPTNEEPESFEDFYDNNTDDIFQNEFNEESSDAGDQYNGPNQNRELDQELEIMDSESNNDCSSIDEDFNSSDFPKEDFEIDKENS